MEEKPKHIVCAVRGRPVSRQTVTHAVDLALAWKARLTFLHVTDVEFVEHATVAPVRMIYQELAAMGEFAMLILVDRAKRRGVGQVDFVIREGNVRKQVRQYVLETRPEALVIGQPRFDIGRSVFSQKEFEAYVAELEEETGLKIIQVPHEEPAG